MVLRNIHFFVFSFPKQAIEIPIISPVLITQWLEMRAGTIIPSLALTR
jgi:hypothetical protein